MTKSADRSSWKAAQNSHKLHQKTKLALLVLALLIFSLLFSKIIMFTKGFERPFSQGQSSPKNYSWNRKSNINLVLRGKDIAVLTYKPSEQEIYLIKIPSNSYLNLPQNLGHWPLSSIYDLGQGLKPPQGQYLLKTAVSNLMGLPIDSFLQNTTQTPEELLGSLRKNPLQTLILLPAIKTDLNIQELVSLGPGLSQVRFDKVQTFDLNELNLMQLETLPDGTEVLTADTIRIDSLVSKLTEGSFRGESLTIAIYNGTGEVGLAQKAARMVTNLGGNVIITNNLEKDQPKSGVYVNSGDGKKLKLTSTYERLVQIFGKGATIAPDELVSSRAEINVILGEDFAQRF